MRSGRARCSRPSNSLTRPSDAAEQLGDTWHCKIQRSSASENAGSSRVLAHVGAEESHAGFAAATAALRGGKATQRCARSSCTTDPGRYILNTRFKYIKRQTKPLSELLFVSSIYQRLDMRNTRPVSFQKECVKNGLIPRRSSFLFKPERFLFMAPP